MMLLKATTAPLSVALLCLGLIVQPAFAQEDAMSKRMTQLQGLMEEMAADMETIEAEGDPETRRRMLRDHMESMHDAMTMMQKEMLPSMRRVHRHKKPPVSSGETEEIDSEEHLQRMDSIMEQMGSLMEQMSRHRRAMRDTPQE